MAMVVVTQVSHACGAQGDFSGEKRHALLSSKDRAPPPSATHLGY
jgi:hypothetical protein